MTKLIRGLLIFINILAVFGLVMVKIGSQTNPNSWLFPSYFSFFLFPLALVNVAFLVFWIFRKKLWFILSLVALISFFGIIRTSFPINFSESKTNNVTHKIKLLSYNTMASQNLKPFSVKTKNEVMQYILKQNADIVCLQEFAVSVEESRFTEKEFDKLFSIYPYKHIKYKINRWNRQQGVATLSKYPIVNKQDVKYESKINMSIYTDILIGKDTVRIINNHLESNRITSKDMQQTAELRENFDSDKFTDMTKYFSQKLSIAAKVRAVQADSIANIREKTHYKLIVCGDFNDVPSSYAYTKVRGNLNDAFTKTQTGLGWTYNRSYFRFRIDYILYDNSFTSANYKRGDLKASDHYPIQTDLYLK